MASANFINECKKYAYENRYGRLAILNGAELNQSNVIQYFMIDSGAYDEGSIIGTVYCKKLNAQLINALDKTLENASFLAQVGVKYDNNNTEYINLGKFTIEKPKDELIDNYTSFVAYDDLANNIDKPYVSNINYTSPKTLADLYQDVCLNLGLTPKTLSFLNSDIPITNNPFRNNETNRFVLETICKIASSFVEIDVENNQIDLAWLSNNNNPDYIFQKRDYSTVNGGKVVYGPVNSLVIRSSSLESENVSISDSESIEEYGEHSIIIVDDYILNTPQLRQQALTDIWERVHNLQYVDCELTTYTGKPFLPIGSKIRIYTDEEEYFDTYVLQHQFTFDGTFRSVIKSPAMTEQQVAIKQDISLGERLRQTYISVDKQNGVIESVVRETTDTSNPNSIASKQSVLTQRVDTLESEIQNVAGMVMTKDSMTGTITFTDETNTSEPITLEVYPIGQNISYLYPRENLYPSDTLYMTDRIIRFHNNTTGENFDYTLPDDLLYYDSEHYDKFRMDLNSQTCEVIKKCKYNADGTVSLLASERTNSYTYEHLEITEGTYTVSIYGYNSGFLSATLMAKNIYTDQFYTKVETDTKISQTEQSINLSVNQKLSNYSTTNEMNSAITLKANEINSVVSTKVGNNEIISKINQSSEQVLIGANKVNISGVITAINDNTTTTIDGSKITTGTITADEIRANTITANKIVDNSITATKIANSTITGTKIANNTITDTNIASLNADKITAGTVATERLSSDVITTSNLSAQKISANQITTGTLSANRISGGTINGNNVTITNLNASNIRSGRLNITSGNYYLRMGFSEGANPSVSGLNVGSYGIKANSGITATSFAITNSDTGKSVSFQVPRQGGGWYYITFTGGIITAWERRD